MSRISEFFARPIPGLFNIKVSDVFIIIIGVFALVWAFERPLKKKEKFGSDWNSSFWGPMLWTGWNYGTPDPRTPPRPESNPPSISSATLRFF